MKITLESNTFKTLASERRVNILKSLEKRRKTLTELPKEFNVKPPSMKEQLEKSHTRMTERHLKRAAGTIEIREHL